MRKKVFIAAAIILLLLFSFIAVLRYRQYSSYQVPVHRSAQTIIKVNVDDFIEMFISNYGFNFKKKIAKKETNNKVPSLNTGIWIPGNVFVYNLSNLKYNTLFCTIPVFNQQEFILYAQKKWKLQWIKSEGIFYASNTAGTVTIACNNDHISMAWSPAKEKVQPFLKEILNSKNLSEQKRSIVDRFKKVNMPLVAINGHEIVSAKLEGENLLLYASVDSIPGIRLPATYLQKTPASNTHSSISLNGTLATSLFKKEYFIKQTKITTDSILKYLQGYLSLEISPGSLQKDSITSYEYDDNFEKIARLTITEVQVPSLQLTVKAAAGLLPYLQQQQIVTMGMKLNRELFPLYEVDVEQHNQMLHFSTGTKSFDRSITTTPHFFAMQVDVQKTNAQLNLPFLNAYLQNILELKLTGNRSQGKIIFDGKVLFRGSALQELVQLSKLL